MTLIKNDFLTLFIKINNRLKLNPQLILDLRFQAFQDYSCSLCGNCCINPDGVLVDQEFYENWEQIYLQKSPKIYQAAVLKLPQSHPRKYAKIKNQIDSQRCSFLEEDNRCYLHANFGSKAQPIVCQNYPKREVLTHQISLTSHLTPTCKSVPDLWFKEPELIYNFVEGGSLSTASKNRLHSTPQSITPYAYHLWLGALYDNLSMNGSTAFNLQRLLSLLHPLFLSPAQTLDEESFSQAYSFYIHQSEIQPVGETTEALKWLLERFLAPYFPQINQYFIPISQSKYLLSRLKSTQLNPLRLALKYYLYHASLGRNIAKSTQYNLLEEFLYLISGWILIQLFLIYSSQQLKLQLNTSLMSSIVNQVSRIMSFSQILQLQYSPEDLLTLISQLLSLDFIRH